MWNQAYDPLQSPVLSTLVAALPLVVLLGLLARHGVRAHYAALLGLAAALAVAIVCRACPRAWRFAPQRSERRTASFRSDGSSSTSCSSMRSRVSAGWWTSFALASRA